MSVLVTGATGTTGRRVAAGLLRAGVPVRTASRHRPTGAEAAQRHVHFDWNDDRDHDAVLRGVRAIYLIPPIGVLDPVLLMHPFLDRARSAGVRRVVLLSASAIEAGMPGLGQVVLAETFPGWAVLRPSWFMQNFTDDHMHARSIRDEGEIVTAAGDGKVGFIDADDIAAVAVRALTDAEPHNTEHLLTGPQALSYADIAATITELSGRPVRHRRISVAAMRERHAGTGMPGDFAALLAHLDGAVAGGAENRTTTTVAAVTGAEPVAFRDFCAADIGRWQLPDKH